MNSPTLVNVKFLFFIGVLICAADMKESGNIEISESEKALMKFRSEMLKINEYYKRWLSVKYIPSTPMQHYQQNTCDTTLEEILRTIYLSEETDLMFDIDERESVLELALQVYRDQLKKILDTCFEERLVHERFEWLTITSWFKAQMTNHYTHCAEILKNNTVFPKAQCLWQLSLIYNRSDWQVDEIAKDFAAYGSGVKNVKKFLSTLNSAHSERRYEMDTLVNSCLQINKDNNSKVQDLSDGRLYHFYGRLQEIVPKMETIVLRSKRLLAHFNELANEYIEKVADVKWWEPEAYEADYYIYRVNKWEERTTKRISNLLQRTMWNEIVTPFPPREMVQLFRKLEEEYKMYLKRADKIRQFFDSSREEVTSTNISLFNEKDLFKKHFGNIFAG